MWLSRMTKSCLRLHSALRSLTASAGTTSSTTAGVTPVAAAVVSFTIVFLHDNHSFLIAVLSPHVGNSILSASAAAMISLTSLSPEATNAKSSHVASYWVTKDFWNTSGPPAEMHICAKTDSISAATIAIVAEDLDSQGREGEVRKNLGSRNATPRSEERFTTIYAKEATSDQQVAQRMVVLQSIATTR